jgi:CxxC motif-containing protein (DUF1111 family)
MARSGAPALWFSAVRNVAQSGKLKGPIMKLGSLRWIVPVCLVLPFGYKASGWMLHHDTRLKFDAETAQSGRELFLHEWTPGDPLAATGDGLGPVFNASSCVACHRQGGAGGGGPLENNVTVFTKVSKPGGKGDQGVVHKQATDEVFQESLRNVAVRFPATSRPALADLLPSGTKGCISPPNIGVVPGVDITQRNTPALFGACLIDAIPDRAIIANERKERLRWGLSDSDTDDYPVGRAIRLSEQTVGKFGWKANVGSLSEFVRVACANELGLGNPKQAQPASLAKPGYRPPGLDLTEDQCNQITAFVASLPKPVEVVPDSPREAEHVAAGKKRFATIGCTDCHTPDLGEATGIYSDLLLHRMGSSLVGGGTYGDPPPELPAFVEGGAPQPSEWRTPPLWGVADSAPYLHDGRATTLADAIKLHGGQGATSAKRFLDLPNNQKEELIAFLHTLRAP